MSDMGDMYREMREEKQARRHANLLKNQNEMDAERDGWTKHNSHHYSQDLQGSRLQYWPSSNKWHWNRRSYNGTYVDVMNFIRKRS